MQLESFTYDSPVQMSKLSSYDRLSNPKIAVLDMYLRCFSLFWKLGRYSAVPVDKLPMLTMSTSFLVSLATLAPFLSPKEKMIKIKNNIRS